MTDSFSLCGLLEVLHGASDVRQLGYDSVLASWLRSKSKFDGLQFLDRSVADLKP